MQLIPLAVAACAGLVASAIAWRLTLGVNERLGKQVSLRAVVNATLLLVRELDGKDFTAIYGRLLRAVGLLFVCQFAKAIATLIPLVAIFLLASTLWGRLTHYDQGYIQVEPFANIRLVAGQRRSELTTGELYFPLNDSNLSASLQSGNDELYGFDSRRKSGASTSGLQQLLLLGMGFELLVAEQGKKTQLTNFMARPYGGDRNPAWPWLSDPECAYFLTAAGFAIIASCTARQRAS